MATINGNKSANTLTGTLSSDLINAYEGNDTIRGGGGNDLIYGGAGSDRIVFESTPGANGVDTLFGYRYTGPKGAEQDVLDLTLMLGALSSKVNILSFAKLEADLNLGKIVLKANKGGSLTSPSWQTVAVFEDLQSASVRIKAGTSFFNINVPPLVINDAPTISAGPTFSSTQITITANDTDGGDTIALYADSSSLGGLTKGESTAITLTETGVSGALKVKDSKTPLAGEADTGWDIYIGAESSAADTLAAASRKAVMYGLDGADSLSGSTDGDIIFGGSGNDTITGGGGTDTLSGEAGDDTYVYASSVAFVSGNEVVDDIIDGGGAADRALITGAISVTSSQSLARAEGIDILEAAANSASAQAHSIVINSDSTLNDVRTIDLDGSANAGSTAMVDLTGVTLAMTITGVSAGANTLTGGSGADAITGGSSADNLTGGSGINSMAGGSGNDTYVYASSADFVTGSAVVDSINDSAGAADRALIAGTISIVSSQSLARAEGIDILEAATNSASALAHSIEINSDSTLNDVRRIDLDGSTNAGSTAVVNLTGTTQAMTIIGVSAGANTLTGGSAADSITGGSAADSLTGGSGINTLAGAAGDDTYVYSSSADFVTGTAVVDSINDSGGTADRALIAGAISVVSSQSLARAEGIDILEAATNSASALVHSIEISSDSTLNDVRRIDLDGSTNAGSTAVVNLTGVTQAMTIIGVSAGANTLTGGAAADTITGGSGNDTYAFATSASFVTGTAVVDDISDAGGTDRLHISGAISIANTQSLARAEGIEILQAAANSASALSHSIVINSDATLNDVRTIDLDESTNAGSTAVVNMDGVSQALTIIGVSAGSNTVTGGSGADTITGGTGADSISAGGGADEIIADDADVLIDGGNDSDTMKIAADAAFTDLQLANIETVTATADGADVTVSSTDVKGTNNITTFNGYTTDGTAIEKLIILGTANADTLDYSSGITINDSRLEVDGGAENDAITGTGSADILKGAAGADTIIGGAGADTLTGGLGADDFRFNSSSTGTSPLSKWPNVTNSSVSTTGFDVVYVVAADDDLIKIESGGTAFTALNEITTAESNSFIGDTQDITTYTGTYDSVNHTFTSKASASSSDLLIVWDQNGAASGTTYNVIVLVGVTDVAISGSIGVTTTLVV